ncbi:MAG: ATP-binding cassette domain-containing protein, partial [Pseudomonadota bacterium]
RGLKDKLLILDEPTTGLHPSDVSGLLVVLDRLVRQGATIIVVEHNLDVVRAADWIVDMGPGSGPNGGEIVYEGPFDGIKEVSASVTAKAIDDDAALEPRENHDVQTATEPVIQIRGASANNLNAIDVDIPKGQLTAVTGISGSGKSSLVRDVLEVEARRRYLESLSMYERQGTSESSEANVDSVHGLGVTLPLASGRRFRNPRLTVGSATDMTHQFAALLSRQGARSCPVCDQKMEKVTGRWFCGQCGEDKGGLPEPRHFIANVYGSACLTCQGMGTLREPVLEKLIIAPDKPLCAGAMYSPGFYPQGYYGKPFNGGYYDLQALAEKYGFDPFETPWGQMSKEAQDAFLFGDDEPMEVTYVGRKGHTRKSVQRFHGVFETIGAWDQGGTYTEPKVCPACHGGRLRPEYLAVTLGGYNMHDLCTRPVADLVEICDSIDGDDMTVTALEQLRLRVALLSELGLGYLHLDRRTASLSAGEAQRLSLAKVIASGLSGLTVLLDEPSRGMHPREVEALINMLHRIRDNGNTAIVVEHDPDIILSADHIIDVGPGAGAEGGHIVASGPPEAVKQNAASATAKMLNEPRVIREPHSKTDACITIRGAAENNLQVDALKIPLGLIVGVCGVSGSGKSTLIMDTLARVVAPRKQTTSVAQESIIPGVHQEISGYPPRCVLVDQAREGIQSPSAFLGLTNAIAREYAASNDAVAMGMDQKTLLLPCGNCDGQGHIRFDMGFLPSEDSLCESCDGSGYREETKEVRIRGVSFPDVFRLTVSEAYAFWRDVPKIATTLQLLREVGLGYLVLNQSARTLSGGEVQRLKICKELMKAERTKKPLETLYLLDEPTAGLHLADLAALKNVLFRLRDKGASIIVVEHHVDMLVDVDWLIELGPNGGQEGGRVIAEGPPIDVANMDTPTAPYLKRRFEE